MSRLGGEEKKKKGKKKSCSRCENNNDVKAQVGCNASLSQAGALAHHQAAACKTKHHMHRDTLDRSQPPYPERSRLITTSEDLEENHNGNQNPRHRLYLLFTALMRTSDMSVCNTFDGAARSRDSGSRNFQQLVHR